VSRLAAGHQGPRTPERLSFHLIPHTHWDREWYLSRTAFQARLIPVMDAMLAQLERDPAARFLLDGQTILLEDYLAIRPGQESRIATQVERGALEIGPWYVLSDLLIPGAAALRRNLEEGTRDAARFGRRLPVLYSPDAFGHPAELPELAAEYGIRWAVIRRGLGRPRARDRDFYRWESPLGATLLVHHLPAAGYDVAIELVDAGDDLERCWRPIRHQLVERASSTEIAVFLGADHHPMIPEVSGLCARLQVLEPAHEVRISGLTEFFDAVERSGLEAPTLRGELRGSGGHTWVLQDVHSTRSRLKRRHAKAELRLSRIAEPLARLARSGGDGTASPFLLRSAWRSLLQCQFHDTIAGTTCDAAQLEQDVRLAAVEALSGAVARTALTVLGGHDSDQARAHSDRGAPRLLLWNPVQRSRSAIVTAELSFFRADIPVGSLFPLGRTTRSGPGYRPFVLEAPSGESLPVQLLRVETGEERLDAPGHYPDQDTVDRAWVAFRPPEISGLGLLALTPRLRRASPGRAGLLASSGGLSNRFLALELEPGGSFVLTDRQTGERYPGLAAFLDEPDRGDCYTFSRAGPELRRLQPLSRRVIAQGPLVGALETRWTMASAATGILEIRMVLVLHADSPLLRLRLDIQNHAADHRLRLGFPLGLRGTAVSGTAVGLARRSAVRPDRAVRLEQEVTTAPAQRFAAAAAGARGLAILAPGCFECEWTPRGELRVTLLRSVGQLSRGNLPERPGHAAWPQATPLAQEPGCHLIELALGPVTEAELEPGTLERHWEDAFLPPQAVFLRDYSAPEPGDP
jgi:2-O-(6-phospho-alpha-D-mannosyl)-D-glycerate hydrolase